MCRVPSPLEQALSSLELNRAALLRGIMQGFARAYDVLAPDGPEGMRIATGNQVLPSPKSASIVF